MFELIYQPWDIAGHKISEVKRITLDAGQNLDRFESSYKIESAGGGDIAIAHAVGIRKAAGSTTATEVPVIGGFPDRNLGHGDANLFARHPDGAMPPAELADYLERYAIGCLLVSTPTPALERRTDLLRLAASVETRRLYVTLREPSYLAEGDGRVRQGLNRITVESASGDAAILRFHFMPTLRCRPGCTVERVAIPGDRVGFLRVPRPPRRFEIYNSYEWPK